MTHAASLGTHLTVTLPQGNIRYREAGYGPPIVFVHGLLVNGDLWRRVVPLLSGSFRCIVPDLPLGSHRSPMPESADLSLPGLAGIVSELLVALEIDEVTLVGTDTGGAISQMVIARHPERIARLVLTNCDAYQRFPVPILLPFKWAAYIPGFMLCFAAVTRFIPLTGRVLYAALAHHNPGKTVLSSYFSPLSESPGVRRDVSKAPRAVTPGQTLAAARAFPSFSKPVLIVWGDDDHVFWKRDAQRLARDFPNARLETVAASRAFVSEDQPEMLASLVSSFIAEAGTVAS